MNVRPSILCPIDYSDASAVALRYAATIAHHFVTRLIVLTVEDPLLTAAMDLGTGVHWTREISERGISNFVQRAFGDDDSAFAMCEYDVAVGNPPAEIVRVARERSCNLIVMSAHGLTGAGKSFVGSTTERVLGETTVPVLVTPPTMSGPLHVENAASLLRNIVAPVDLSSASHHQVGVAGALAATFNVPLTLMHVVHPLGNRHLRACDQTRVDSDRRSIAKKRLDELVATLPQRVRSETLIVSGDPAEESARVVRDRQVGLVVISLCGVTRFGPRVGSITSRILCLTSTLVLALPPKSAASTHQGRAVAATLTAGAVH